ncbi:MAG: hypothetical protein ACYTA5_11435 [Planctomycetota bacterium]|jgi:hypothetical protein
MAISMVVVINGFIYLGEHSYLEGRVDIWRLGSIEAEMLWGLIVFVLLVAVFFGLVLRFKKVFQQTQFANA